MISIHPLKSYRIIDACRPTINAGKALRDRMRAPHKEMLKLLVRLLQKEVQRIQRMGGQGFRGKLLHQVRTNRKNLAQLLNVGEKTVYNHLERLAALGCIKKTFRGSNASFQIEVNPALLYVQDDQLTAPVNVADRFASDLPVFGSSRQSLPHTLPRVPWVPSKSNKGEGLTADVAPAAAPAEAPDAVTPKRPGTESGYLPSNDTPGQTAKPDQATEVPAGEKSSAAPQRWEKRAPAPTLPASWEEVAQLVPANKRIWLQQHTDRVYEYALDELAQWFPTWLSDGVREKGRIALAEYFAHTHPRYWKSAGIQFADRVDLVCKYLERRTQNNQEAWLPLPHLWFDLRSDKGFAATKAWWKANKTDQADAWKKEAVDKALTDYWRALESKRIDADETLFAIKQRLDKKSPELFDQFLAKFKTAAAARAAA